MKTNFETFKSLTTPKKAVLKTKDPQTLKGVLLNNYIKKRDDLEKSQINNDFDNLYNDLLVVDNDKIAPTELENTDKNSVNQGFEYKKALKPLVITSAMALGAIVLITSFMKSYSKTLATKSDVVRPGDLARNINILEEPHFAMYRALRDPSAKNIFGLIGVGIMSAVTLVSKNLVDGIKDVWVKKQNFDVDYDFQKNMIEVETKEFSGKLNFVNGLLKQKGDYFKKSLNFKGKEKLDDTKNDDDKKQNKKAILALLFGAVGFSALSFMVFRNYQKTLKNLDTFKIKFEHNKITDEINNAVKEPDKNKAIKRLVDILKVINAKDDTIKDNLSKINGITQEEIEKATKNIHDAQIYVSAPEALGGISEKIQYYCYINEERGHLYNWILNPENKFNKYLFLSFSAISALGYVAKNFATGFKDIMVNKQNAKNELELKRKLVEVEINNFKSKKLSAINPLVNDFEKKKNEGKSKEVLSTLAQNILLEIKNGPPYIYS